MIPEKWQPFLGSQYSQIQEDYADGAEEGQIRHISQRETTNVWRSRSWQGCRIIFTGLVFILAMWGIANIGRRTFKVSIIQPGPPSCSCGGTTTAEAERRGCIFTPMAIAWLPPHCLDMELAAEFDEAGPGGKWDYWADANGTIPLSREQIARLADTGDVFYTSQEWHIVHCMFTWRKHFRAQFTGTVIEARSNGIRHIEHCEEIVKIRQPLDKIWTHSGIELNADLV